MNRLNTRWIKGLISCLLLGWVHAAAPMLYVRHSPESADDRRYDYHWAVLQAALEKTRTEWGEYRLQQAPPMNESRQFAELLRPQGLLNVVIRETNNDYERRYRPVRIPIDRGLLGYRVMLIRKQDQNLFDQISDLAALRKIPIIQGEDWGDVAILQSNQFKVVTDTRYEGLFRMLSLGKGMAFSRGITEVEQELRSKQADYPDMRIEKNLLLYYPLPTYFWFQSNAAGEKLASRVEQGMQAMLRDGEFERLFQQYHSGLIERLQLKHRRLFRINTPGLPTSTPFADSKLWYHPLPEK